MPNRSAFLRRMDKALGPCPTCGKKTHWYNHVPLTGYCFGPANKEHPEMSREVPAPFQIYGKGKKTTKWVQFKG